MVFHGISIIVRTANDCDFQRQKRYISAEEEAQQLDRSNVSDALFPHRRRCAKTFLPTYAENTPLFIGISLLDLPLPIRNRNGEAEAEAEAFHVGAAHGLSLRFRKIIRRSCR